MLSQYGFWAPKSHAIKPEDFSCCIIKTLILVNLRMYVVVPITPPTVPYPLILDPDKISRSPLDTPDAVTDVSAYCSTNDFFSLAAVSKTWKAAWAAAGRPNRDTSARLSAAIQAKKKKALAEPTSEHSAASMMGGIFCLAAWAGDLEALRTAASDAGSAWASQSACRSVTDIAARGGHLELLMWARVEGCPWSRSTCRAAARFGHLNLLQWVRGQGCPWNEDTCSYAARGGHLAVLKWSREQGCPWNEDTCSYAAKSGHVGVLQWARQQGCPWNEDTCSYAANSGHFGVLQWARQQGCPWNADTCSGAAGGGHVEILQWAREQGCPWDKNACRSAAGGGHLGILQSTRRQGCLWDVGACNAAASGGHERVLQWLQSHGCPWGKATCSSAALRGHLEVLQSARACGCPWDETTCSSAAKGGYLNVLQWARNNRCPWDSQTIIEAAKGGHMDILKWARARGCPLHRYFQKSRNKSCNGRRCSIRVAPSTGSRFVVISNGCAVYFEFQRSFFFFFIAQLIAGFLVISSGAQCISSFQRSFFLNRAINFVTDGFLCPLRHLRASDYSDFTRTDVLCTGTPAALRLGVAAWKLSSGRGNKDASGRLPVGRRLEEGTGASFGGPGRKDAIGTRAPAVRQLGVDTWKFSSGRRSSDAGGTRALATPRLLGGTW